ncbi:hypothetical protein HA466_0052070 [Hirschfeldia incana]|nr:hypothetical protein HA466_0052070 [Hirschfeldia incana]
MTKINSLCRCLLPCITPPTNPTTASSSSTTTTGVTSKKRLSTSLRDDIIDVQDSASSSEATSAAVDDSGSLSPVATAPQRPSRTMVIGTLFGRRKKGHVWFSVQHDRLSVKPLLLLELSVTTNQLVREMDSGLVRVALECPRPARPELKSCSLKSVPVWTMFCNGRKSGFAVRRSAGEETRAVLKRLESTTVGAGVLPCGSGSDLDDEVMYMRASYEHVVGSSDSESFHLINPDANSAQELSIFLLRTSS